MRKAAAAFLVAAATLASAEGVDIVGNDAGAFQRTFEVAPKKFAELCGQMTLGQRVAWRFRGAQPVDFNVHYHEGKTVIYPARQRQVSSSSGELEVGAAHAYCWMWENKGDAPVSLAVELQRR